MKHYYFFFIVMCLLTATHCSRKQPTVGSPPTEIKTLQPVATVDLLPDIPEPSGLAYNSNNNTLMVVSDSKPDIFEIDFTGAIKRKITTTSSDLEGVAINKGGDTLFVVEERNQMVVCYRLDSSMMSSFPVRVATLDNNALEGVTIDNQNHLFVLNEKNPRLLLEFRGAQEISRREITAVADLSDVCYDETTDAFWIVSDESRKIIATTRTGTLLGEWLIPFDKGEGIASVGDRLFIANDETGKLYVFDRPILEQDRRW